MTDKEEILAAMAAGNAALSGRIGGVNARIDELRDDLTGRIDEVKKLVDAISTQTGQTELDVRTIKSDVAGLRMDLAAYRMQTDGRLTALEARPWRSVRRIISAIFAVGVEANHLFRPDPPKGTRSLWPGRSWDRAVADEVNPATRRRSRDDRAADAARSSVAGRTPVRSAPITRRPLRRAVKDALHLDRLPGPRLARVLGVEALGDGPQREALPA